MGMSGRRIFVRPFKTITPALCELRNSRDAPSEFETVGLARRDGRRIARKAIGGIANARAFVSQ
jgi:hypothetical protein